MTNDLKPCPWCGTAAELLQRPETNGWYVGTPCECDPIAEFGRQQEAAEWWNKRWTDRSQAILATAILATYDALNNVNTHGDLQQAIEHRHVNLLGLQQMADSPTPGPSDET